jgi:hypothetical protein
MERNPGLGIAFLGLNRRPYQLFGTETNWYVISGDDVCLNGSNARGAVSVCCENDRLRSNSAPAALPSLGRRCCETLLLFSFKWQPNIATTFRALTSSATVWRLCRWSAIGAEVHLIDIRHSRRATHRILIERRRAIKANFMCHRRRYNPPLADPRLNPFPFELLLRRALDLKICTAQASSGGRTFLRPGRFLSFLVSCDSQSAARPSPVMPT